MTPPVPRSPDAWQAERDDQLETDHQEHNDKVGGGEIQPGEVEAQRQEHNERTGGGPV